MVLGAGPLNGQISAFSQPVGLSLVTWSGCSLSVADTGSCRPVQQQLTRRTS